MGNKKFLFIFMLISVLILKWPAFPLHHIRVFCKRNMEIFGKILLRKEFSQPILHLLSGRSVFYPFKFLQFPGETNFQNFFRNRLFVIGLNRWKSLFTDRTSQIWSREKQHLSLNIIHQIMVQLFFKNHQHNILIC